MKSTFIILNGLLLAAALISNKPTSAAELPYNAANKSQLFVDQLLVREADRVWFKQHQGEKHPQNPLVKADQPWEGWRLENFGSVIFDEQEKLFKMWYLAEPGPNNDYFDDANVTCYATSKDGIHWEKPLVSVLPAKNGKPHNAVTHYFLTSVMKDMKEPDPARRYKMICWLQRHGGGYHTAVSPDGLNWTQLTKTSIAPGYDVMTGFWDESRGLYVAYPKLHQPWRGHERRLFNVITSKDLEHWTEPKLAWKTDLRDDVGALARVEQVRPVLDRPDDYNLMRSEFYGIGIYPAESCIIGFPWILTVNNNARFGNQEGPMEVQLAVSRDLENWERPFRLPIIEIGQLDQWDASCQLTSASAIRVGDEIWLYYTGANYTHGSPVLYQEKSEDGTPSGRKTKYTGSVGLVTWKLDRFVSAEGPAEGGVLTTVPLRFAGNRLEINAAVRPGGKIVVEILDAAGRPLQGFSPSDPFSGDELRHVVTFGGKSDVAKLSDRPIVLKFHITDAGLYSFAFRD